VNSCSGTCQKVTCWLVFSLLLLKDHPPNSVALNNQLLLGCRNFCGRHSGAALPSTPGLGSSRGCHHTDVSLDHTHWRVQLGLNWDPLPVGSLTWLASGCGQSAGLARCDPSWGAWMSSQHDHRLLSEQVTHPREITTEKWQCL
jgi:hypothetical protein